MLIDRISYLEVVAQLQVFETHCRVRLRLCRQSFELLGSSADSARLCLVLAKWLLAQEPDGHPYGSAAGFGAVAGPAVERGVSGRPLGW